MAYNYEYPYFDAGNYNSDWLLRKMKELEETVIGLETFKYIGENEILDLNQQKQNSIAAFTSNFNVLNSPVSNVQRVTVTYGSETAYIQQLYDLSKYTVYTRNYSTATGWTAWKLTQNAPGTVISTSEHLNTGDFNDLPDNKALFLYTNAMQHAPVNGYGYLLTWSATSEADKIQVFFSTDNGFIYLRSFSASTWSPWVEANHMDLTHYLKLSTISDGIDLNNISNILNRYGYVRNASNRPISNNGFVFTYGSSSTALQMYFSPTTFKLYWRYYTGAWTEWYDGTSNYSVLHRADNNSNSEMYIGARFGNYNFSAPISNYAGLLSIGYDDATADTYQIGLSSDRRLFSRFRNNSKWTQLYYYQHVASTTALTITSTPEEHSTDAEGKSRYIMGENMYSEVADSMYNTYISLPGQSLLHSDEGKQSFKDAILAADLSDTDIIMTNLEMWDMDIPLDTIAEEVAALSDAITAKNPMCELTLLSIPPIDIPLWGDELLDYTMPNGSTLRQVDDRLFRLSEEHPFSYVSFEHFYAAQNTNLMAYRGKDFKTNKQYLRRVGSFIKNTM